MYLLHELKRFWKEKKYEPEHLHVITCDHCTRPETKEEIKIVTEFSYPHNCTVVSYIGEKKSEETLRERRHNEFIHLCKQEWSSMLFLGHHFDDRVETSILNMIRGCGIEGMQWMKIKHTHYKDKTIIIVRPLLFIDKVKIMQKCEENNIKYCTDPTNINISISKRNKIRSELDKIPESKNIKKSFSLLYEFLDKKNNEWWKGKGKISELEIGILYKIKAWERTSSKLYDLYISYNIVINPRSTTLDNLARQLTKNGSKIWYQWITIRAYWYGSVITKEK